MAEIAKLRGVEELSIDASILTDEGSLRYLAKASDLHNLKIERGLKLSRLKGFGSSIAQATGTQ